MDYGPSPSSMTEAAYCALPSRMAAEELIQNRGAGLIHDCGWQFGQGAAAGTQNP